MDSQIKLDKNILTFFVDFGQWDSKLLDFQVPRYLKSGLGRAGLGPWVGPWQCCAGARRRARPRPGNLEIQKFGIPWNPCDKDFRILDLLEPLRQRFQNFGPTGTLASKISRFPDAACAGRILRSQPDPSHNASRDHFSPSDFSEISKIFGGFRDG